MLQAGAGMADISPADSQFLFGYPHVERYSIGIHDPLLSCALYLSDGQTSILFVSNDIIFLPKPLAGRARARIETLTGVPAGSILLSASHTHSGPITVNHASNEGDPTVPKADPHYLEQLQSGIVAAAVAARRAARSAEVGLVVADGSGIGTNRRDVTGPSDPQVPVLLIRAGGAIVACMLIYSMHPTVLHEDSRLVSADFPGYTRRYLQAEVFGRDCPVLYHTGPAGNQSVRHIARENTFAEAERLGAMLGERIARVAGRARFVAAASLAARHIDVDLPRRTMPSGAEAECQVAGAAARLAQLRQAGAPRAAVRRAEVDWFGAEETLALASAADEGRLAEYYGACLPAEVQVLQIGSWRFVGWPGEVFTEYALQVKSHARDTYLISLANGELQGYIATESAAQLGGYEAGNAIFAPAAGDRLVQATLRLLQNQA
jgi:neutral ceramidase